MSIKSVLALCVIAVFYMAVNADTDPVCCGQFSLQNQTEECKLLTCYGIHHNVSCTGQLQNMCACSPYLYLDRCSGKCVYHTNCPSDEETEQCQDKPVDFCPSGSA